MRNQVSSHKKSKSMTRIIKTPIRAISKALDLYVKGVSNLSNTSNRPLMTSEDTPNCQRLPRSFTTSRIAYNDQPAESALVRSISTAPTSSRANQRNIADPGLYTRQHPRQQLQSFGSRKGVPRSTSVGMGKIDEDRALSFRMDNIIITSKLGINDEDSVFSRSRSYDRMSSKRRQLM